MATLKELARTCEFRHTLPCTTLNQQLFLKNLLDRLVCGIAEPSIQRRLLGELDLSFERALEIALAMESAATNTAQLHHVHNISSAANVHNLSCKPGKSDKPVQHEKPTQKPCFCWGKPHSLNGQDPIFWTTLVVGTPKLPSSFWNCSHISGVVCLCSYYSVL